MHLPQNRWDLLKRYCLALVLAGLALSLRGVLPFKEGTSIYQLPLAAVILSAWYGGRGPGLLASLICVTGASYFFVPPVYSFATAPDHLLPISIFAALCLLLTEFGAGRRRVEHGLRVSDERFRTLVQFSFDVYWETDAQHRFVRQEFSERMTDAPARGAEIGKARWEIPYVEPDEEAWRKHRETMEAHLPFRDFELARPTPEGGKRYVSVSGMPVFDRAGRFVGYRGVGRHTTEQKRAEAELRARQEMLDLAQAAAHAVAFDWFIGARESENRWSPELEAMYGQEPGTFDGTFQSWKKLVHADDWPAAKLALKRAHESGDIAAEYRVTQNDGSVHWLRAKGRMFFDAEGQPERMVGFMIDITDLRHAEEEHRAYLWFLESMDRINRAIQGADELDQMMSEVLKAALEIFACDRAWIVYPCDPRAPSWRAIMEHTRPEFPGAFALEQELPTDAEIAAVFEAAQAAPGPVLFGSNYELKLPPSAADRFSIRSQIAMAIEAKGDKRHLFGLHQCSHVRVWTGEEQRLFQEIGRRLGDAIGALSMLRSVRDSERKIDAAQRIAHVGWWERDFGTNRVALSDEVQRIFGVRLARDGWWEADIGTNGVAPSDELQSIVGARRLDLPQWQDPWANLIHPEDQARTAEAKAAAIRGGPRYDVEYRVIRPDGTVRVVHSQGDVVRDDSGRPLRQFGVLQDITELRRAEDELRATETYLEEAQRLSHTGSWALDVVSNKYIYTSDESDRIYGFDPEADPPSREAVFERIHPEDRSRWKQNFERSLREKVDVSDEYRIVLPDGSVRHIRAVRHPVLNSAGNVVKLVGTSIDITERKSAEEELRASEARFRTFVDHATDAFFLHNDDLLIIDANRQACASLGYSREELIGMHPRDFDVGLDESSIARLAQRAGSGEAVTFETLHRRKDGIVFPVEIRARTFQQGDNRFRLSFARDISERKLTEETLRGKEDALQMARTELAHVSRLTTLGELTTSIAHEVSQPLGAMINSAAAGARWLAARPPDLSEARSALDNIAADGIRAREVIARIRALTKRQTPRFELLDMSRKVLEVLALTEHELRSHDIVLQTELSRTLPPVAGDRVQLQQVFLNLILNASEAMSGVQDRMRQLTIVSARDGANAVAVEVRDVGTGLDPERAERVFEPFYTTKSEGIGIGLSISRSIVEAHGGRLSASANQPYGAIFRVWLPIAEEGK